MSVDLGSEESIYSLLVQWNLIVQEELPAYEAFGCVHLFGFWRGDFYCVSSENLKISLGKVWIILARKECTHVLGLLFSQITILFERVQQKSRLNLRRNVNLTCLEFWDFSMQLQEECIPVGCVPSTAVAVSGGVSAYGGKRGLFAQGGVHPPPRGQNSWHMLVKTLPFCNYCCGR